MPLDILEPKKMFSKNCYNNMVSDSSKKHISSENSQNNIAKKYQKPKIVHNLWRSQSPQPSILSNI